MNSTGLWVQILLTFGGIGLAIGLYASGVLPDWGYMVLAIGCIVLGYLARRDIEKKQREEL